MDIISRKEAKVKGLKYYFTGKECKNGHIDKRAVCSGTCNTCRNIAARKWYHINKKDKEWKKERIIKNVRSRARRSGIEFNLTVDSIEWPDVCPVLGIELDYTGESRWNQVSLDKTDPKKGYTPDNTVVMSMRANSIKQDSTIEEIEKLLAYMYIYSSSSDSK